MKIRLDLSNADLNVDEENLPPEIQAQIDEANEAFYMLGYIPRRHSLMVIKGGGETTPGSGELRSV